MEVSRPSSRGATPAAGDEAELYELQPGEVLLREGEAGEDVFEVVDGTLAVLRGPEAQRIATLGPGDTIGEIAALAGTARTATVRAIDLVTVRRLPDPRHRSISDDELRLAELTNLARTRIHRHRAIEVLIRLLGIDATAAGGVVDLAEWVHLDAGDVLFARGEQSDAGYLVVSGRLGVTVDGTPIGEIARGEIVGEMGLIERAPRSATVAALRDSALARFDVDAFQRLAAAHPAIMAQLARTIVARAGRPRDVTDRARSVVVCVTAPLDPRMLLTELTEELRRHGTTRHLWAARVNADLGQPGLVEDEQRVTVPAIAEYIEEAEATHDYLLYETDRTVTNWTRRTLSLADRILVVMSAHPDEEEVRRAEAVLAAGSRRARVERWLALVQPAATERPSATAPLVDRLAVDRVAHVREGSAADLHRLARLVSGNATGLVLGGGGARGFAHLGVWQALEELGVVVDAVAGASIGAPLGACMALQLPARQLIPIVSELFHGLLDYTVPVVSLIKGERVTRSITKQLGGLDLLDLWLPFACVSTNLTRSVVHVHERGSVPTAVRASVAIPGILPPVPFDGDLLVDGGVLNNLPCDVMQATQMVSTVIAVDLSPAVGPRASDDFGLSVSGWSAMRARLARKSSPYPGLMPILMRSMVTGSVRTRDRTIAEGGVDCYLDLDLSGVGLLDFERVEEVAARGYAEARPRLEAWLEGR